MGKEIITQVQEAKRVPYKINPRRNIRQTLTDIKGEIDSNTIIVGDFNIPLTPMDRSSKQKINKETQVLNDTLDETDLIDIFRKKGMDLIWNVEVPRGFNPCGSLIPAF